MQRPPVIASPLFQVAPATAFGLLAGIQHTRFWETSITGVREFPATRINGVGMDAEVIGDAAAQGSEVKGAQPLRFQRRCASRSTSVIPQKTNRPCLRAECSTDGVLWCHLISLAHAGGAPLSVIAEHVRNQRKATSPT
jgi:hypothetical protein